MGKIGPRLHMCVLQYSFQFVCKDFCERKSHFIDLSVVDNYMDDVMKIKCIFLQSSVM